MNVHSRHGGEIFITPRIPASKLILSKMQTIQDSQGEEEQRIELGVITNVEGTVHHLIAFPQITFFENKTKHKVVYHLPE